MNDTPEEWIEKAEIEGGIYAGFEYGLTQRTIDDNEYPYFYELIEEAHDAYRKFELAVSRILSYNVEDED